MTGHVCVCVCLNVVRSNFSSMSRREVQVFFRTSGIPETRKYT